MATASDESEGLYTVSAEPANEAVIVWKPAVVKVASQVAMPVVVLTGWVAQPVIGVPPSLKATVPPSGAGVTVAV